MKCGFCERLKKLRKFDVILIACICLFLFIGNRLQVREIQSYKEKKEQKIEQVQDAELQVYEDLQRECYFKNIKSACESLKKYE